MYKNQISKTTESKAKVSLAGPTAMGSSVVSVGPLGEIAPESHPRQRPSRLVLPTIASGSPRQCNVQVHLTQSSRKRSGRSLLRELGGPLHQATPVENCRTTRDPPAKWFCLGRCRFVTASIFHYRIPRRAIRIAPLALPHHEWLPLENAAQYAFPLRVRGSSFKIDFSKNFIAGVCLAIH